MGPGILENFQSSKTWGQEFWSRWAVHSSESIFCTGPKDHVCMYGSSKNTVSYSAFLLPNTHRNTLEVGSSGGFTIYTYVYIHSDVFICIYNVYAYISQGFLVWFGEFGDMI